MSEDRTLPDIGCNANQGTSCPVIMLVRDSVQNLHKKVDRIDQNVLKIRGETSENRIKLNTHRRELYGVWTIVALATSGIIGALVKFYLGA